MPTAGDAGRAGPSPLLLGVVTAVLAAAAGGGSYAVARAATSDAPPAALVAAPPPTAPLPTAAASPSAPPSAPPSASPSAAPSQRPTALTGDALTRAKLATVRLSTPDDVVPGYSGSGSVISPDGLILTNAHVAAPDAPGQAVAYGQSTQDLSTPDHLVVSVNAREVGPAVPTYRAELLAADGYLDLAVVRITSMVDGSPLPARLGLTTHPLGSVRSMTTGDQVSVIGFPGVADSSVVNVTPAGVSFVPDPLGRVEGYQFEMETGARIAGGNSGGAAVDPSGRLVGVPTAVRTNERQEQSGRIRSVDLASELILAARAGRPYTSPHVVLGTGEEAGEVVGWTAGEGDCSTPGVAELPAGTPRAEARVRLTGMTPGEDVMWELSDGTSELLAWDGGATGCLEVPVEAPYGTHELRVLVGPSLRLVASAELRAAYEEEGGE